MDGLDTAKKWEDMTWEEKREERFGKWLNPDDVQFVSPEAKKLYRERVTRFIKAIRLEEPDRVPVMLPTGTYPAYYAGASFKTIMWDYDEMKRAWIKFMDDFGDMDTYMGPGLVPCGRISQALDSKVAALPGMGLPETATMNQIVEGEYMMADEYDAFMMDPTDYHLRVLLPRTAGLFESFRNLPPLRTAQGAMWVSILSDPAVRTTVQTLMDLADENERHLSTILEISRLTVERGYPPFLGFGLMTGAPFDHFGDLLRGTRGIVMDMYRQPQKLHEAMEYWLNVTVTTMIKDYPMTSCPVCVMPLHKGDDTFMSDKQFEEFYWPTLRRLFLAMIEEGLVPLPFAEGRYTKRLKFIADTPRSGVVWWFDQTDMAEAKRVLGNVSCILGNVPTSVVMTGTTAQVKENCRRLIEMCAHGGGYILGGGAAIDNGRIENLKVMMEAACEYGVYK